jgi:hypothetical protein
MATATNPTMISKENKVCYLIGDFNLDLLNNQYHLPTGEFLDIMLGHMLFPLIDDTSYQNKVTYCNS